MAEDALSVIERGFSFFKIAALSDLSERWFEVGHLPLLNELAVFGHLESRGCGVILNPTGERDAFFFGERGHRILADGDKIFRVARAVTVIAIGFPEPLQQVGRMAFSSFF